jgi:hypothetical protein
MTALAQCASSIDVAKQIADLNTQLDTVEASVNKALDDLLSPENQAAAASLAAVIQSHDSIFSDSTGSLNSAFVNAGVTPIDRSKRDAEETLERNDFVAITGTLYVTGNRSGSNSSTSLSSFEVGAGLADLDELRILLDDSTYTDPTLTAPTSSSSTTKSSNSDSSTGTYLQGGTVDMLRELAHGFSGDLSQMKQFLEGIWERGCGIVWSIGSYDVVEMGSDTSALTANWVREKLSYPAYDEEITLDQDLRKAIVWHEYYVGNTCSKLTAQALARDLASTLGISGTPALICRVVRLDSSEDVRGQRTTIRTHGFTPASLGKNAYELGITVGGLARVVDVTGDYGTRQVYAEYTTSSVAAAISRVFGPYLSVSANGGEICFATTDSGPNSSLGFFSTSANDAATALGIDGAISYSYANKNRTGGVATSTNVSLADTSSLTWTGGSSSSDQVTSSFVSMVKGYGLTTEQTSSLIGGSDHWSAIESDVATLVTSLETEGGVEETIRSWMTNVTGTVRTLEAKYGFVDLVDLRYGDAEMLYTELGTTGLADLLNRRPKIDDLNLYVSATSAREQLNDVLKSHSDSSALDSSKNTTSTVSEFVQNHSKIAKFGSLFEYLLAEYSSMTYAEAEKRYNFLVDYASSLTISTGSTVSTNGTTYVTVSNLSDAVTACVDSVVDKSAASDGMAAAISTICSISSKVKTAVQQYWNEAESAVSSAESAVADTVGAGIYAVVGPEYRAILATLTLLNTLLVRAQGIVSAAKRAITSLLQAATGSTKSITEILEDLSNLQYNVYGNLSFQTKFVSCYVSSSGSSQLSAQWQALIDCIDAIINALSTSMNKYVKSIDNALAVIECIADKLIGNLTGTAETTTSGSSTSLAGGLVSTTVSYTMTCVSTFGFTALDPAISREIAKIRANLALLSSMLSINIKKHNLLNNNIKVFSTSTGNSSLASDLIASVRKAIEDKLNSLLSC